MNQPETIPSLIASNRFHPVPESFVARIDLIQQRGLIILPTSAQLETDTATIVALGSNLPDYLAIGTRVLPHTHSGLSIFEDSSQRLVSYKLKDIQAVFTPEATEAEIGQFFLDHEGKTTKLDKRA